VRFAGRARVKGKSFVGAEVRLQRRFGSGDDAEWRTITKMTTSDAGGYAAWLSVTKSGVYRAFIPDSEADDQPSARSTELRLSAAARKRTLEDRAAELKGSYGKTSGAVATLTKKQLALAKAKGAKRIAYRSLKKALLVEVAYAKKTRTWLVKGAILEAYDKRGGADGSLGVPIEDPRCGLPDDACLQTFTRGTVYSRPGKTAVTTARGAPGDLIAVARTQVGFRQQGSHSGPRVTTKYQKWAGSKAAWCSIFLAWVADRAGHPEAVKKHSNFLTYRSWVRGLKRLSKPKVGALVVMDGGLPKGHAALVASVSANGRSVTLLDGNWNMRVNERTQGVARSMEFYWPYD
jgi:uncharacterized protein (TIGR02594 family)